MVACNTGYYSIGNQTACTRCPPGFECPSLTTDTMYVYMFIVRTWKLITLLVSYLLCIFTLVLICCNLCPCILNQLSYTSVYEKIRFYLGIEAWSLECIFQSEKQFYVDVYMDTLLLLKYYYFYHECFVCAYTPCFAL